MDCAGAHRVLLLTGERTPLGAGRGKPCTLLQSRVCFSPIFTSPFCPLPSLSIANSGLLNSSSTPLCDAQGKLAVPVSWRHCSFFPLGCKLPSPWQPTWAIALHGKDAWSSAGKDGGHSVMGILALTSDTATVRGRARHEMRNGCTETSLLGNLKQRKIWLIPI